MACLPPRNIALLEHHKANNTNNNSGCRLLVMVVSTVYLVLMLAQCVSSTSPSSMKQTINDNVHTHSGEHLLPPSALTRAVPVIQSQTHDRAHLTRRSTQFSLPQEYFEQLNAQNHKPRGLLPIEQRSETSLLDSGDAAAGTSQSLASPASWPTHTEPRSAAREANVKLFSAYGRPSTPSTKPSNEQPFVYFYPPNLNLSQATFSGEPSSKKRLEFSSNLNSSRRHSNTKLLEQIYKHDLAKMSAKLSGGHGFKNDADSDEDGGEGASVSLGDDDEGESKKYANLTTLAEEDDSPEHPVSYKLSSNQLNEYRQAYNSDEEKLYHLPSTSRQFESRSASIPIRLQTAHSHPVPHATHYYTMAHAPIESDHHHYLSADKSHSWLGSGLAAGILIGAIPFGIMMASMMPTLLTSTVPIVNTAAAVGRRRRKRSVDLKNLLFDQVLETVSMLMRKGLAEATGTAKRTNNVNMHKEAQSSNMIEQLHNSMTMETPEETDDTFKVFSRYMLAAVDQPRCLKEMVCSLLANGKKPKTSPWQKTLFLIVKWMPKDLEKSLGWIAGLNELFEAVRRNSCIATYKCREKRMIDEYRKRTRPAGR